MKQDKWYVSLYGSNEGRVYVGPLGATCGVAEVHTTAGREQALRDAETIVDAVNSVEQLREQNRVLVSLLGRIDEHMDVMMGDGQGVPFHTFLTQTALLREQVKAALTATSQPGGTHEL